MENTINIAKNIRKEIKRLVALEKEREQIIADVFPDMAIMRSDKDIMREVEVKVSQQIAESFKKELGEKLG